MKIKEKQFYALWELKMLDPRNLKEAKLRFEKKELIGSGSFGKVYLAHDLQLDAELVIKEIKKENLNKEKYFLEAQILYLGDHQYITPVHYACECEENIYIAMPYYKNGSLENKLSNEFISVREIINIGIQILSALHNLHSRNLLHFDVKPSNILIFNSNEVHLTDFGLAKHGDKSMYAAHTCGFLDHAPPEFFSEVESGVQHEIYQVGMTLYRMCIGEDAFQQQTKRMANEWSLHKEARETGSFPDFSKSIYPDHIPLRLKRIISHALEPDRMNRYFTALDMLNELCAIPDDLPMMLDWNYTVHANSKKIWSKRNLHGTISLTVEKNNNSCAMKSIANSQQRIRNYCKSDIKQFEIQKFLREH